MNVQLNIGLNIEGSVNSQWQRDARADLARRYLMNLCGLYEPAGDLESRRAQSATEDTLVVALVTDLSVAAFNNGIERLACDLCQDCIAVLYTDDSAGALIGPNATAWGEFNQEYFIRYDSGVVA